MRWILNDTMISSMTYVLLGVSKLARVGLFPIGRYKISFGYDALLWLEASIELSEGQKS